MLFKRAFLQALRDGEVDLAFRRWERARVKVGSRLRTAIGVLEVTDVSPVAESRLTRRDAERAGFATRAELLAALDTHGKGKVHRVTLRLAGADPRIALRNQARITADEATELAARLARLDKASRHGAWTRLFKADVRKLKELGLTESLEVGYRLSPRGRAWLKRRAR